MRQLTLLIVSITALTSCAELTQLANSSLSGSTPATTLTNADIIEGLKQALSQGVTSGVQTLSATDGFFRNAAVKILFPPEAQRVEKTLRDAGLGNLADDVILKINRAAEDAAKQATPIFVNAIRQMTINDAMGILMGNRNAATDYLRRTTTTQLYNSFNPVIKNSLQRVQALKVWEDAINTYNKIPLVTKMNPRLDDHVTNKAIEGVFHMVEQEEGRIRANPTARTSDLMRRVFARQDRK